LNRPPESEPAAKADARWVRDEVSAGRPHLAAVLIIAAMIAVAYLVVAFGVDRLERNYVHALLSSGKDVNALRSLVMERCAFRQADLLPLYGSSELIKPVPNRPTELFRDYPTGFSIFPVGKPGTYPIIMLQHLVGVGPELRGRKVAVSISAGWFRESEVIPDQYRGNFLLPTAREFLFSTHASYGLRQEVARRIGRYQETFENDSVVAFAIHHLAGDSWFDRAAYWAAWPLGRLQILISRGQDHFEVLVAAARLHKHRSKVRPAGGLDWAKLFARAEGWSDKRHRKKSTGLPRTMSIQNTDGEFLAVLGESPAWDDFELLLRTLQEMGARPLVLCTPLNGRSLAEEGVSPSARTVFYRRMAEMVARHQVTFCGFSDHDADRDFVYDRNDHLSPRGWLFYNQVLDDFMHDRGKREMTNDE
jgi:D-alanine transfer protein